jgi:hypothetical protein
MLVNSRVTRGSVRIIRNKNILLIVKKEKGIGHRGWFIYRYGYFSQVMIIPLNPLFFNTICFLMYAHFLHDIHVGVCSYGIMDCRQY